MKVHLVAPTPHRDVTDDWEPDAYVGKCLRLARMLVGLDHEVVLYAGPRCDVEGVELVEVVTDQDRTRWFGDQDWSETVFNQFDPRSAPWEAMNGRVTMAMRRRIGSGDIIFLTMGSAQAPLRMAFPDHVVAECGVGYEGVLPGTHRCYESLAWMHYIWGRDRVADGRWFDIVIPNAFDPADYIAGAGDGGYLLFMGRLTERKGLEVVRQLARDHTVVTAGQGEPLEGVEHLGVLRGTEKAAALAGARTLICATTYIEPFGGVAAEAMLSGTPVLASPFGAFSETVAHGWSGYLCHTLADFRLAAEVVGDLDREAVRQWAAERFTMEVVAPQYDWWLDRLVSLYDKGWYQ